MANMQVVPDDTNIGTDRHMIPKCHHADIKGGSTDSGVLAQRTVGTDAGVFIVDDSTDMTNAQSQPNLCTSFYITAKAVVTAVNDHIGLPYGVSL